MPSYILNVCGLLNDVCVRAARNLKVFHLDIRIVKSFNSSIKIMKQSAKICEDIFFFGCKIIKY